MTSGRTDCEEMIRDNAAIVDVRTPEEFNIGHVEGSRNIPLSEIENHIDELRSLNRPLVLCCQSGFRSGQATQKLKAEGIVCCNGGSWVSVRHAKLKKDAVV